jgi:hypothetical protein
MPADWVEMTCALPLVYRTGEKSIRQHFEPVAAHLDDRSAFLAAVGAWLRRHPDLIDAWHQYCEDKRTTGLYFSAKSLEVGVYEVATGHSEISAHDDPVDACADFIYREAISVLRGVRTS